MLKSNAYGHGIAAVAHHLQAAVEMYAVHTLEEALIIQKHAPGKPVLMLHGAASLEEMQLAAQRDIALVFHQHEQLSMLAHLADDQQLSAWLLVDTGMGRIGFSMETYPAAYQQLMTSIKIRKPLVVMSHWSVADVPDHPHNQVQLAQMQALKKATPEARHSFNSSSGIDHFPQMAGDIIRPGLSLYGVAPGAKPVMTLKARVIQVQAFNPGSILGYGATYRCPSQQWVAVLDAGYADGMPLAADQQTITVHSQVGQHRVLGRVSMDMMVIECQPDDLQPGDEVTLWGEGAPVETLAAMVDRSPYEILTAMGTRVKSVWSSD